MVQKIRYFKTDNAENPVSAEQLRACKHELEVEPCAAPGRQQGLALLLSLQNTPQLKGHSLEVRAPLGQSTIWRPLQEVRVVPQGVLDIKAVKGKQCGLSGPIADNGLSFTRTASSRAASGSLMYRRTLTGGTKLDVLKEGYHSLLVFTRSGSVLQIALSIAAVQSDTMLNKKKGPRKPSKSVSSSFAGSPEAAEEEHKINLLDSGAVKRELDEGAIRAAKGAGLQEDHYVSNVKILLGLITCSIAGIAQFYPRKHPDNWWLLLCCVVAYALCTAALNLFLLRFEGEAFFFTKTKRDLPALKFVAKMPRYSDQYTLLISKCNAQDHPNSVFHLMPWLSVLKSCIPGLHSSKTSQNRDQAEMTHKVTKYFHSDGYLNEALLSEDVRQLLKHPDVSNKGKAL